VVVNRRFLETGRLVFRSQQVSAGTQDYRFTGPDSTGLARAKLAEIADKNTSFTENRVRQSG
jgi:hypothetical protein